MQTMSTDQPQSGAWSIGIDVGGTFTDVTAVNLNDGRLYTVKLPSTPQAPAEAMLDGIARICADIGISPEEIGRLAHGTTVATNALIESRGERLALITTKGFRDVLEIGRQVRPYMFDFHIDMPPPLVERELRFEIAERILADGSVHVALSEAEIARVVEQVRASGVKACAICLLFSFRNDAHERRVRDALKAALPKLALSISSEVHAEFREFERFSTTAINTYVQPIMARYLDRLETGVQGLGCDLSIGISQSSGGLMPIERAKQLPVRTALSGPAAGIVGALANLRGTSSGNFITIDMGGTSADVSLVRDFVPGMTSTREIEGRPVKLAAIDINAVGAGGGSIAWIDRDGLMKVGPQSAGAVPGPACYRRGGTLPTVSDANLYLGRLSAGGLLGGTMPLDAAAAARVIVDLSQQLGLGVKETALGIIRIVNSNMVRAIRQISVERGLDPREFELVAFGGAGPLHAADVARALGIPTVIVPARPGLLCAEGLLNAPLRESYVRAVLMRLDGDAADRLVTIRQQLAGQAEAWFDTISVDSDKRATAAQLDLRYVGQNFELSIPFKPGDTLETIRTAFLDVHRLNYGHADEHAPIEVVALRLDAIGNLEAPSIDHAPATAQVASPYQLREAIFENGKTVSAGIYRRGDLPVDARVGGPAIIEQLDSTIVIGPTDAAHIDRFGNLIIEVGP